MQPPDGPPVCTALIVPVGDAAAHLLDDRAAAVVPIGTSTRPVLRDLAGQGEDLGPLALLGADAANQSAPVADDRRDVGERLDVVDERRAAPQARSRPGRAAAAGACRACPRSRPSARSPRRRRTRRRRCGCRRGSRTATRRLPLPSRPSCLACLIAVCSRRDGQRILGPDVDEALAGADRVGGDGHALQDAVRVALQDAAVHEGAGVALVGVADDVLLRRRRAWRPSPTSGRSGSRRRRGRAGRSCVIVLDHLGGRHLASGPGAAPGSRRPRCTPRSRSGSIRPLFSQDDRSSASEERLARVAACAGVAVPPSRAATIDGGVGRRDLLVERRRRDRPATSGPSAAQAAGSRRRRPATRSPRPALGDGLVQRLLDAQRPSADRQPAGGAAADADRLPRGALLLGDRVQVSEIHRGSHPFSVPSDGLGRLVAGRRRRRRPRPGRCRRRRGSGPSAARPCRPASSRRP